MTNERKFSKTLAAAVVKAAKVAVNDLTKSSTIIEKEWSKKDETFGLFDRAELKLGALLGSGGFSDVYEVLDFELQETRGTYNSPPFSYSQSQARIRLKKDVVSKDGKAQYVVKHLKFNAEESANEFCMSAADLVVESQYLSCLNHDNIVKIHAWSHGGVNSYRSGTHDGHFLILDRLYTTLDKKIGAWQEEAFDLSFEFDRPRSSFERKNERILRPTEIARQIAKGVEYLHSKNIVFRDLKPDNIGFDENGTVKLFDFGLVRELPSAQSKHKDVFSMTGKVGTARYMAPEVALCKSYNQKVDVYSWSMLYWQCLSLVKPYKEFNKPAHLLKVCKLGRRPSLTGIPDDIGTLLQHSWDQSVRKRFTIAQVCAEMDRIQETLTHLSTERTLDSCHKEERGRSFRRIPNFMRNRKRVVMMTSAA